MAGGNLTLGTITNFFRHKKPWSKYKDLILDYYLEPYLNKVKELKQPIVIIDCFAGPGKYDDGEPGSPRIIANKLQPLYERGIDVQGIYIEANPELYKRLQINAKTFQAPNKILPGNFQSHLEDITQLAKTHTVFVYLDPIRPSDLLFDDLKSIYDHVHTGQSVETLINFLSRGFLRMIWGLPKPIINKISTDNKHQRIISCNLIAGGTYWQNIAFDRYLSPREQIDNVAQHYSKKLNNWFKWTLTYPIREKYRYELPKYRLIFGSRHNQAVDLMNRAMVKARKEFVGAHFTDGLLFDIRPEKEIPDPVQIMQTILDTSKKIGKTTWQLLRAYTTVDNPGKYTDSEFNREIKKAIQEGKLGSNCTGEKKDDDAFIWPIK